MNQEILKNWLLKLKSRVDFLLSVIGEQDLQNRIIEVPEQYFHSSIKADDLVNALHLHDGDFAMAALSMGIDEAHFRNLLAANRVEYDEKKHPIELIWDYICNPAERIGGNFDGWTSSSTLVEKTGLSKSTVLKYMRDMAKANIAWYKKTSSKFAKDQCIIKPNLAHETLAIKLFANLKDEPPTRRSRKPNEDGPAKPRRSSISSELLDKVYNYIKVTRPEADGYFYVARLAKTIDIALYSCRVAVHTLAEEGKIGLHKGAGRTSTLKVYRIGEKPADEEKNPGRSRIAVTRREKRPGAEHEDRVLDYIMTHPPERDGFYYAKTIAQKLDINNGSARVAINRLKGKNLIEVERGLGKTAPMKISRAE